MVTITMIYSGLPGLRSLGEGGGKAHQLFGDKLLVILDDLNKTLAA